MKRILSLCLLAALLLAACTAVADAPPSAAPDETPAAGALPAVGSMEHLRALLASRSVSVRYSTALRGGAAWFDGKSAAVAEAETGAAPMPTPAPDAGEAAPGAHSQTNSQVAGVDEGDIIKTDGAYLYVSDYSSIAIVKADGADMERLSRIKLPESAWLSEMYVRGDRLVAVYQYYQYEPYETGDGAEGEKAAAAMIWRPGKSYTVYAVYDIADRGEPALARSVEIEGSNLATRMAGDVVYFVNQRYVYQFDPAAQDDEILPAYRDTAAGGAVVCIGPEKIVYAPESTDASYLLVGAFNVSDAVPCEPVSILGAGGTVYMNAQNLYIAHTEYPWGPIRILAEPAAKEAASNTAGTEENRTKTSLYRLALDGTEITLAASGELDGWLLNQYSMDEYDGYLRVAATLYGKNGEEVNGVYVLRDDLSLAGAATGLAEGETIQSVRFSGATGYVVTYEQTDPLFVLDLSDPAAPAVVGELKIPGFSQYLHDFGDGLLVGVGRNTVPYFTRDENGRETVEGVMDKGMKVSVFDVSDPQKPREAAKLVLGTNGSIWSEASGNPRSIMVDAARGVLAFPVSDYSGAFGKASQSGGFTGCVVLEVSAGSVSLRAALGGGTDQYYGGSQRTAYIGDTLYRFTGASLVAYDYGTCAELSSLTGLFA